MREILFRGIPKIEPTYQFFSDIWKKQSKNGWVYGSLIIAKDKYYICVSALCRVNSFVNNGITSMVEVIPESVGEYTELTDKNGKKVFEGDIFKFNDEVWESCYTSCGTEYDSWDIENYAVVGFDEETARYDFVKYKYNENSVEADLHENHDIEFADFVGELEIIGNIHDNPELMRGEEE